GGRLELGLARASRPEGLEGPLELAARSDARVTEDRRGGKGHRSSFVVVGRRPAASSTSSAASWRLKVYRCTPGAPPASTASTSCAVRRTPISWRVSASAVSSAASRDRKSTRL